MSARNSPCPCGSGKKYKVCCLKGPQVVNRILNGDGAPVRIAPSGPTCGGCIHFREAPQVGPRDLNQPAPGNCLEHLHGISLVQFAPNGQPVGGIFVSSGYPPTHEDFPACGRYQAKQTLAEKAGLAPLTEG